MQRKGKRKAREEKEDQIPENKYRKEKQVTQEIMQRGEKRKTREGEEAQGPISKHRKEEQVGDDNNRDSSPDLARKLKVLYRTQDTLPKLIEDESIPKQSMDDYYVDLQIMLGSKKGSNEKQPIELDKIFDEVGEEEAVCIEKTTLEVITSVISKGVLDSEEAIFKELLGIIIQTEDWQLQKYSLEKLQQITSNVNTLNDKILADAAKIIVPLIADQHSGQVATNIVIGIVKAAPQVVTKVFELLSYCFQVGMVI